MQRKMMDRLIRWKEKKGRKPLILTGVRQVGKTHLLKEFGRLHFPQCHYFNFEKQPELAKIFQQDLIPERIITELSFTIDRSINIAQDLIIFDEIQVAPKALTSLKYFQEDCPELYLCAAESLLGLRLNSSSFPVGKVTFERLRPMSFEEFLMATDDKALRILQMVISKEPMPQLFHDYLWDQLKRYFVVGGLPEVVTSYYAHKENLFEALTLARKKQDDLLNSYYADITKYSGKINAMHIDRVFRSVPIQLSQTTNNSTARFKVKGIVPGVVHYDRLIGAIYWLEKTGLTLKVPIVNTGHLPSKMYEKENFFKLLLFDIGILGNMCGISPKAILDFNYSSYPGYFAENFIAQELLAHGYDSLISWQENKAKIEFLLQIDGNSIPAEVKSGFSVNAKNLKAFSKKHKPLYEIIISGRPFEIHGHQHYYPLYIVGKIPLS